VKGAEVISTQQSKLAVGVLHFVISLVLAGAAAGLVYDRFANLLYAWNRRKEHASPTLASRIFSGPENWPLKAPTIPVFVPEIIF
jgi:hypothetical protein